MAQATYDAFISDKKSKYARRCCYGKRDFFSKVGLENGNPFKYEVTKFLSATVEIDVPIYGDVEESNWIGYAAVATDEGKAVLGRRDIVIAWRGTDQIMEWIKDFQFFLDDVACLFGHEAKCKVHQGFYSIYTATDPVVLNRTSVQNQVKKSALTGHSLDVALATLNAVDIVGNGFNIQEDDSQTACPVTAVVFASPRIGDSQFHKFFSAQKDLRTLRIRNKEDIVPRLPSLHSAEVGEELEIDTLKSNFLKHLGGVKVWHNLEVYLHGVEHKGRKEDSS
ncbi:phospholipase A1-IIgamma-like [Neltuma alba]|uniref:phospholipase A1-IIgamma-like n=1 Tax=Neltuma alba TaxID=207710 RepID=UPI0010A4EE32|nr:phospholipase A1-IIgamma-like [Prosopis alba]